MRITFELDSRADAETAIHMIRAAWPTIPPVPAASGASTPFIMSKPPMSPEDALRLGEHLTEQRLAAEQAAEEEEDRGGDELWEALREVAKTRGVQWLRPILKEYDARRISDLSAEQIWEVMDTYSDVRDAHEMLLYPLYPNRTDGRGTDA